MIPLLPAVAKQHVQTDAENQVAVHTQTEQQPPGIVESGIQTQSADNTTCTFDDGLQTEDNFSLPKRRVWE